jgi:hypothetical protein
VLKEKPKAHSVLFALQIEQDSSGTTIIFGKTVQQSKKNVQSCQCYLQCPRNIIPDVVQFKAEFNKILKFLKTFEKY